MYIANSIQKSVLALSLPGMALASLPFLRAQQRSAAPVAPVAGAPDDSAPPPVSSPDSESVVDQRVEELIAGVPTCTALRLTSEGVPDMLMHLYFGARGYPLRSSGHKR
jgi:hypothetical protein